MIDWCFNFKLTEALRTSKREMSVATRGWYCIFLFWTRLFTIFSPLSSGCSISHNKSWKIFWESEFLLNNMNVLSDFEVLLDGFLTLFWKQLANAMIELEYLTLSRCVHVLCRHIVKRETHILDSAEILHPETSLESLLLFWLTLANICFCYLVSFFYLFSCNSHVSFFSDVILCVLQGNAQITCVLFVFCDEKEF